MRHITSITLASIAFAGTVLVAEAALAQQRARGCCHATGCSTIGSAELQKGAGETYTVTATGEVFVPPDQDSPGRDTPGADGPGATSPKPGRPYQWSEDGEFHRCGTSQATRCLMVPRPGA